MTGAATRCHRPGQWQTVQAIGMAGCDRATHRLRRRRGHPDQLAGEKFLGIEKPGRRSSTTPGEVATSLYVSIKEMNAETANPRNDSWRAVIDNLVVLLNKEGRIEEAIAIARLRAGRAHNASWVRLRLASG